MGMFFVWYPFKGAVLVHNKYQLKLYKRSSVKAEFTGSNMKKILRSTRAFTLIELLVVILIIGVLAAVAIPQYQKAVYKSRYSALMPINKAVADNNEVYYLAHSQYATDPAKLDITKQSSFPDGTQVTLTDDEDYSYASAQRADVPNNKFIIYQKKSPNFASTTQCEAKDDDPRATWLCKQALHGKDLGGSVTGEGWTAYLLSGSEGDSVFGKACETTPVTSAACASGCGTMTRDYECNHRTGEWEYDEYDTDMCPSPLPAQEEDCGAGLVGKKTRTSACNAGGTAYEYGEWNTDNCAPACQEEDLVLTQACGDGYNQKTRTQTGCDSNGEWTYTDWDDSACCKGEQELSGTCDDGYETKTRTVTGCSNASWVYADWNTDACCNEEEKVLTEKCDDGYADKTRTVTGCSNGAWTYTDWDDSACCKGEQELSATCDDGYETKTRTVTGCSNASWVYADWNTDACCNEEDKVLEQACPECGKQTRSVTGCSNGEWQYNSWTSCPAKPADKTEGCDQSGYTGAKTYTYVCNAAGTAWEKTLESSTCTAVPNGGTFSGNGNYCSGTSSAPCSGYTFEDHSGCISEGPDTCSNNTYVNVGYCAAATPYKIDACVGGTYSDGSYCETNSSNNRNSCRGATYQTGAHCVGYGLGSCSGNTFQTGSYCYAVIKGTCGSNTYEGTACCYANTSGKCPSGSPKCNDSYVWNGRYWY